MERAVAEQGETVGQDGHQPGPRQAFMDGCEVAPPE